MHRVFASTKNTRPVLPGSLRYIRSDVPLQVTEEEKQWLAGHNITTVVDLRTERERAAKPCPLEQDGRFRCLHLPVAGGDALPESPAWVAQSYINMADDRMERILKIITEAESNVLFFCTAGKDRTGVVAALLQRRAGCPAAAAGRLPRGVHPAGLSSLGAEPCRRSGTIRPVKPRRRSGSHHPAARDHGAVPPRGDPLTNAVPPALPGAFLNAF